MDQPYSRIADALLDRQYWSPDDPQKQPYDDTGWSFGDTFDAETVRVTDTRVLSAAAEPVKSPLPLAGKVTGSGAVALVAQHGDDAMFALRYRLGDATVEAAHDAFKAGGHDYPRGSWIVRGADSAALEKAAADLGVTVEMAAAPSVKTRQVAKPRLALLHTWQSTQTEGWWRQRLDLLGVPYDYISTQDVAATADLRARWDAILFPPVGFSNPQMIVNGLPLWGQPQPWKETPETPNLGRIDSTDDMRPGLGGAGLEHLRAFVNGGGTLVASEDAAQLLVDTGFASGVRVAKTGSLKVVGTILGARFPDAGSPIADGIGDRLAVYSSEGMSFELSNSASGGWSQESEERPTGRGDAKDTDVAIGRPAPAARPALPKNDRWEARALSAEETRRNPWVIPTELRPRTLLRFADDDELLISGLLENGGQLAKRAAVVEAPLGKGRVVLFAINPIWRGETIGSHPLVWNALLAGDALRPAAPAKTASTAAAAAD
jgi:hypothetical protein